MFNLHEVERESIVPKWAVLYAKYLYYIYHVVRIYPNINQTFRYYLYNPADNSFRTNRNAREWDSFSYEETGARIDTENGFRDYQLTEEMFTRPTILVGSRDNTPVPNV